MDNHDVFQVINLVSLFGEHGSVCDLKMFQAHCIHLEIILRRSQNALFAEQQRDFLNAIEENHLSVPFKTGSMFLTYIPCPSRFKF